MDIALITIGSVPSSWRNQKPLKPLACSSKDPPPLRPPSPQIPDHRTANTNKDRFSSDWDKAWSSLKKQGKTTLFLQFPPNKNSWNPRHPSYTLSEEVDSMNRVERSNLALWSSPSFSFEGAIFIVTLLLLYTILPPFK